MQAIGTAFFILLQHRREHKLAAKTVKLVGFGSRLHSGGQAKCKRRRSSVLSIELGPDGPVRAKTFGNIASAPVGQGVGERNQNAAAGVACPVLLLNAFDIAFYHLAGRAKMSHTPVAVAYVDIEYRRHCIHVRNVELAERDHLYLKDHLSERIMSELARLPEMGHEAAIRLVSGECPVWAGSNHQNLPNSMTPLGHRLGQFPTWKPSKL